LFYPFKTDPYETESHLGDEQQLAMIVEQVSGVERRDPGVLFA